MLIITLKDGESVAINNEISITIKKHRAGFRLYIMDQEKKYLFKRVHLKEKHGSSSTPNANKT